jgi:hypothetical protein
MLLLGSPFFMKEPVLVFGTFFVEICRLFFITCASLQPQKTEPHETESRLAFSTESTSTLLDMEPSKTVNFLAGPMHGLSLIRGFFLARAIIEQKKITTDRIGELKER